MEEKLISKKKPFFKISAALASFLKHYERWIDTPVCYDDLLRFSGSVVVYDKNDNDTLWVSVYFTDSERREIEFSLKKIYTQLHSDGNESGIPYLNIDAIDYCTFGNSKPFRIKVRNILNDNFTYYYIKKTDASRIFGLEFEHMLSPYNLNFLVNHNTLIEEHIAGIPGDTFMKEFLPQCNDSEKAQIAKEYVKFNERSMIRLLGDMRAYNYVVVPTHDFDQVVYKIRPIDFDQQSFEGRLSVYRPQFFKENGPIMDLVRTKLTHDSINQYKIEERSIVARRIISSGNRLNKLVKTMQLELLTLPENLERLRNEIYKFTNDKAFLQSKTMGDIMKASFEYVRKHYEEVDTHSQF
ncbi:hypothetical protein N9555_01790 [Flavobacteriaceae bacterium]|jgi:hypothetical protein|nr:hypothetical protein [Flavobacteriaceae bacterium]MBT4313769.1 hypothetical protein [Flavobacteriaceae bacterium]MBT5091761.1 hypothetical protein [Flavobacteriaceae bacterium]MBT5283291.1 hypothetical protein [Flavobacteriaceae bacterium]MBT5446707.1 hypothetical protein [Flavobacteriaceae bacterium]|tara:strand:+ start:203 stop:1264 length:1062 start_codon:yes stop_codon:yes gene_type:complete